jgi:hypothetical protein
MARQSKFSQKDLDRIQGAYGPAPGESVYESDDAPPRRRAKPSTNGKAQPAFANYVTEQIETRDGKTTTVRRGLTIEAIGQELGRLAPGWPKRVGPVLFAPGPEEHQPLWLETTEALFAWINRQLPEASNPVAWGESDGMVTKGEFRHHLQQTSECFDAVESCPHWPPLSRTYYMHPALQGGDGKALAELVARFEPSTLVDGDLIRAFFLSLLWGGAPGQRPAWLFTCEDDDPRGGRGAGKSAIAQFGARLVGGHIDGSPNEPMEKLITRLLSNEALGRRVVLLDNLKTLRFSWAELEGLITSDVISGHRMYSGEGRRPNTVTYCLTLNGASLSRDMAQRWNIVKVKRPAHDDGWEAKTRALVDAKRWAIIGDIVAALKAPAGKLERFSRWASWEAAVLARTDEPVECQKVIEERQGQVDEDGAEADIVRQAFIETLTYHAYNLKMLAVWLPSKAVAAIVNEATNEKNRSVPKATAYLRTLTIPELRESNRGDWGRGWLWRGNDVTIDTKPIKYDRNGIPP